MGLGAPRWRSPSTISIAWLMRVVARPIATRHPASTPAIDPLPSLGYLSWTDREVLATEESVVVFVSALLARLELAHKFSAGLIVANPAGLSMSSSPLVATKQNTCGRH
jgi:hypothetical protein